MNDNPMKSVAIFFIILLILSLPFWIIGPLIEQLLGQGLPFNLPLSAFQFVVPIVAAFIITYRQERDKAKLLFRRIFDFHRIQKKLWYVPMFFLMPLVLLISLSLTHLWGVAIPKTQLSLVSLSVFFVLFFIAAACEEVGWQGFVYERLASRWNALQVGLIMGVIWSMWHIIPHIQQGYSATWILWQSIFSIGLRLLIVWIYNNTGKSIFAAIVFHAMSNVSVYLLPNDGALYDPKTAALSITGVVMLVLVIGGPRAFSGPSAFKSVDDQV